jgi:UDP-N-acetylmuramate dehydrogenase
MPDKTQNSTCAASLQPHSQALDALNTMGLRASADAFVRLDDVRQLPDLSVLAARYPTTLVLGGGSNVILPERVGGLVVQSSLRGVRLVAAEPDRWLIEAAAGESWHGFVRECVVRGWDGLENLALIPGTVGAAPVQNIGAYGVELSERFAGLTAWDIARSELVEMSAAECCFAYRDSRFKHDAPGRWMIVSVRFALPRPWRPVLDYPDLAKHPRLAPNGPAQMQQGLPENGQLQQVLPRGQRQHGLPQEQLQQGLAQQGQPAHRLPPASAPTARMIFDAVCDIRRQKLPDPAVIGNVGSFFKNPLIDGERYRALRAKFPALVAYAQADGHYKLAAGWLIDQCGWKGKTLGPAGVHDRQALVLVNRGGARAEDILALATAIAGDVKQRFDVTLHPEPVIVH